MLAQRIHRAMRTWLQVPNISEYPGEKWCKAPVVAHTRIFFDCRYGKSDERGQQKFLPFQYCLKKRLVFRIQISKCNKQEKAKNESTT